MHRFSDAEDLASQLPNARLVRAYNIAELWLRPGRLSAELGTFLDSTWSAGEPQDTFVGSDDDHAAARAVVDQSSLSKAV